jgi:Xaa-Pro dipeptidase
MTRAEPQRDLQRSLDSTFGAHIQAVCQRTAAALATCGYAGLLVYAGSPLPVFEDDRTYPFEANAPFKVWVPLCDAPGSFVWFVPGSQPRLIIERPDDYWYKPPGLPRGYWIPHFDVHTVADRAAARALLPADLSRAAYIGEDFDGLGDFQVSAINPRALLGRLDYVRAAKTPYELVCLREANRLGACGHVAAASAFAAGASEFEIELAFLEACGLREHELPYNPIIALNDSAAVLHYQVLEKQAPPERHSLLIDAGAEFAGYASVGGLMRSPEGGEIERPAGHPHLRLTRVLEAGFVVTMEPGIYFIPQLLQAARSDGRGRHINWSRVEALARFGGIRIEDDLAVTHTGCENLTRDAFGSL